MATAAPLRVRVIAAAAALAAGLVAIAAAQGVAPAPQLPDAAASDPVVLGWMVGSPPPPDKRIAFADGSFYRFPQLRWSFSHWRELYPTAVIARGSRRPRPGHLRRSEGRGGDRALHIASARRQCEPRPDDATRASRAG